jgi:hypothetical protein
MKKKEIKLLKLLALSLFLLLGNYLISGYIFKINNTHSLSAFLDLISYFYLSNIIIIILITVLFIRVLIDNIKKKESLVLSFIIILFFICLEFILLLNYFG